MNHSRVDVLGVHISAISVDQALKEFRRIVAAGETAYVTYTGVHGVIESQSSPELRDIHNRAALVCPDGMPMVWACHRAGISATKRVYGPNTMLDTLGMGIELGWRHFFYGGAPGVAEALAERMTNRYPGLAVTGTYCPPFRPLDDHDIATHAAIINESGADIVWVGLSTPKQELWMARARQYLHAPLLMGVGAAFDMNAGLLPQAPDWMQDRGLEWSYRLLKEPRRLWRRYARNNPEFAWRILRQPPRLVCDTSGIIS